MILLSINEHDTELAKKRSDQKEFNQQLKEMEAINNCSWILKYNFSLDYSNNKMDYESNLHVERQI
jgi:hypothetical protein